MFPIYQSVHGTPIAIYITPHRRNSGGAVAPSAAEDRRLSGLSKMSYLDRLQTLSLPTLEVRRLTADLILIFCYKIINGLVSLDPADFFVFRESDQRP